MEGHGRRDGQVAGVQDPVQYSRSVLGVFVGGYIVVEG